MDNITNDVLAMSVLGCGRNLGLSNRSIKCMIRLNLKTIGDLIQRTADDLLECHNFGISSLWEIREKLGAIGLHLKDEEITLPQPKKPHPKAADFAKNRIIKALQTVAEIKNEDWVSAICFAYLSPKGKSASTEELQKVINYFHKTMLTHVALLHGLLTGKFMCQWDETENACFFSNTEDPVAEEKKS